MCYDIFSRRQGTFCRCSNAKLPLFEVGMNEQTQKTVTKNCYQPIKESYSNDRTTRKGISNHVASTRHLARAVTVQQDPNVHIATGRKAYVTANGVKVIQKRYEVRTILNGFCLMNLQGFGRRQ